MIAFRVFSREWFLYRKELAEIHPKYSFLCPSECEYEKFDYHRTRRCDSCPVNQPKDNFKLEVLQIWEERNLKFKFEEVERLFYNSFEIESMKVLSPGRRLRPRNTSAAGDRCIVDCNQRQIGICKPSAES